VSSLVFRHYSRTKDVWQYFDSETHFYAEIRNSLSMDQMDAVFTALQANPNGLNLDVVRYGTLSAPENQE
jgi:hypothetical protein